KPYKPVVPNKDNVVELDKNVVKFRVEMDIQSNDGNSLAKIEFDDNDSIKLSDNERKDITNRKN
ncbi:697_t:CDS:1, partial [Racocetra persica]